MSENKLHKLREPFPANQISKLPKPTKQQTDEVRQDYRKGIRCEICGGWHHPKVVHLDYVGHAALTDRLLDVDPEWNWEPLAFDADGLPKYSKDGLWIKLTICGITRLGFGDAQGKEGPNAIKEMIGDALRNAAMRFGAALDLWHKGDLHDDDDHDDDHDDDDKKPAKKKQSTRKTFEEKQSEMFGTEDDKLRQNKNLLANQLANFDSVDACLGWWDDNEKEFMQILGNDLVVFESWKKYFNTHVHKLSEKAA